MDSSTTGNLVHLEEYVDTIISLPHEIQRNLTMIREHDSQVQETENDLFKDIDEFMSLQSKSKEIPTSERVKLIKRIKNSFLSTLTHAEEKVSLANQCYNSVEKHLIKMEEDLKCFEEEIRLSGYAELLEKVRQERRRQKEQVRNKKRREASMNETDEEESEGQEENNQENDQESSLSSSEAEKQQVKKKKTAANSRASNNLSSKRQAAVNAASTTKKQLDSDDEESNNNNNAAENNNKISRAERLLRRNKPNYVSGADSAASNENKKNEDALENQGDDEAEDNEGLSGAESEVESVKQEQAEQEEAEGDEGSESDITRDIADNYADSDKSEPEPETKQTTVTAVESATLTTGTRSTRNSVGSSSSASAVSSGDDRSTTPRKPSKPPTNPPGNEPIYCTCQRVSFGQMIACDGKECPIEWFHIGCVGLKNLPKGKWYCKECQEAMDAKTAAQLAGGMSTRSSRRS